MCENQVIPPALKPMPRRMKNITLFPYKFNCLCWKIALDIALLDVTSTSRLTLREWPPWCSKLCRCENGVTRWKFCLQSWAEMLYSHCDGNCAGSSISDQNWVKNREAAASRVTLPRLYLQTNQRMNEHQSLLFCSLPACPLLILSFQVVAFEKKTFSTTLHVLALKFQGTWMVTSNDPFPRKQTSEKALKPNSNDISYIFVKSFWISLPTTRRISCNTFFCEAYQNGAPFGA